MKALLRSNREKGNCKLDQEVKGMKWFNNLPVATRYAEYLRGVTGRRMIRLVFKGGISDV